MSIDPLPVGEPLPEGAWDSHVHVIDEDRFPLHPQHSYRPEKATVAMLEAFHRHIGIAHACLVAVSVYHTDTASIVDALQAGKASVPRAVVSLDVCATTQDELRRLHEAGVRGVRVNLRTKRQEMDADALKAVARRIKPFGWVLQVYVALEQVVELAPILPQLQGVQVVIDHLGEPDARHGAGKGCQQAGFRQLLCLLQTGMAWTKLSGAYRFAALPDMDDYVRTILRAAPDRVVWASDWPHTNSRNVRDPDEVRPFLPIDTQAWIARCQQWCKDVAGEADWQALAKKIWVDNPRMLWQYSEDGE